MYIICNLLVCYEDVKITLQDASGDALNTYTQ